MDIDDEDLVEALNHASEDEDEVQGENEVEVEDLEKLEEKRKMHQKRLGKRVAYILRYGAEKEGLHVTDEGFVLLDALLTVPLLQEYEPSEILNEIDVSESYRKHKRFERKSIGGLVYVRALYSRRMERNSKHPDSDVTRLLELCIDYIMKHIKLFDLTNFQDEFLLNTIMHKLRRRKKLNRAAFDALLAPCIENIDLDGVYLTESISRMIVQRCPHIRVMSLRNSGYFMTDHFIEIFVKKLPCLENLNLSHCNHLTDRSVYSIGKHAKNVTHLILSGVPDITEAAVLDFVVNSQTLTHLDIYDNRNISDEGRDVLCEAAKQKKLKIVLKNLLDVDVAPRNPCSIFLGFGKSSS